MAVPFWANMLHRASYGAHVLHRAQEIVRDELLFAFLSPEHRAELTIQSYADEHVFLPGGSFYEAGLLPLERSLLDDPLVPRRGRVLLGAAGAGRELRELVERGYTVFALEPNTRYFAAAQGLVATLAGAEVVRGSYADLVEGRGALANLRGPFDFVHLGFGSYSHLTLARERSALLLRCRELAPRAPLLVTFYLRRPRERLRRGGAERLRVALRRTFRAVGGNEVPDELEFSELNGFLCAISEATLTAEANAAGYEVARFDSDAVSAAILRPR